MWSLRYIDSPVLRRRDTTGNGELDELLYYTNDANMDVTALIGYDSGQSKWVPVERYAYTPYGEVAVLDGSGTPRAGNQSAFDNAILYCGYRYDAETGLYHVRNRYYAPTLGRWGTRDPVGYVDGENVYAAYFVPQYQDPYGLVVSHGTVKEYIRWAGGQGQPNLGQVRAMEANLAALKAVPGVAVTEVGTTQEAAPTSVTRAFQKEVTMVTINAAAYMAAINAHNVREVGAQAHPISYYSDFAAINDERSAEAWKKLGLTDAEIVRLGRNQRKVYEQSDDNCRIVLYVGHTLLGNPFADLGWSKLDWEQRSSSDTDPSPLRSRPNPDRPFFGATSCLAAIATANATASGAQMILPDVAATEYLAGTAKDAAFFRHGLRLSKMNMLQASASMFAKARVEAIKMAGGRCKGCGVRITIIWGEHKWEH